jgi:hypothetical protein
MSDADNRPAGRVPDNVQGKEANGDPGDRPTVRRSAMGRQMRGARRSILVTVRPFGRESGSRMRRSR